MPNVVAVRQAYAEVLQSHAPELFNLDRPKNSVSTTKTHTHTPPPLSTPNHTHTHTNTPSHTRCTLK